MVSQEVKIVNRLGLHARAAAKFVQLAAGFASTVEVSRETKKINGKSIMGVMMLAAGQGTTIEIFADGDDEQVALTALTALVADGFGEN